jgi:hypothetical protein
MATHNPKESRPTCESTLAYIYRGERHEHEVGRIIHLGGNLLSPDPIRPTPFGVEVNLDLVANELNFQCSLHRGKGEDFFKHYVISLAPNEDLKEYQWIEFITAYMQALGYDNSTKWTAAIHKDTDCEHVHILACRVRNDKHGSLVSTYNDYEKGWPVMRLYEKKFGLRQIENPDENYGRGNSKQLLKHESKKGKVPQIEDAASIRKAFTKLFNTNKPKTMRDLVLGLSKHGVDAKLAFDKHGEISGIVYRCKSGTGDWIPGSKVKATRFTWKALQTKEGISYDPHRDDPFLRKDDSDYEIYINLKDADAHGLMIFESNFRVQEQKFLLARFRRTQQMNIELIILLIKLILLILKILFGIRLEEDDLEFVSISANYESPGFNQGRNIDDEVLQRICHRHALPLESLNELDFSLHPKLMPTPSRSHEVSY